MVNVTQEGEVVEAQAVVVRPPDPIVRLAVSPQEAVLAFKQYQEICAAILDDSDFQVIKDRKTGKEKRLKKKSAWRKLATFYNLTIEISNEHEIKNDDGSIDFDVIYRAISPNGRSCPGDGSCNNQENNRQNTRHNTRGTAHTRAFNRAVSNLIGFGEVSAEEVEMDGHDGPSQEIVTSSASRDPKKRIDPPRRESDESVEYDPDYRIDLGLQKSGEPHWLNGKSLEEAYANYDKKTGTSELMRTYNYLKSHHYRNIKISTFLQQAEAFLKTKEDES